jgi:pyruvate ferredoxin oxidoreductase gamma subunit
MINHDIFEIEILGRGGQGAKTASEIVARASIKKGLYIQSFPDYGPERKGAPVRALVRTSKKPIRGCSSESNPDVIVFIDSTILTSKKILFIPKPDCILVINTSKDSEKIKSELNFDGLIYTVDATKIALEYLKGNITNTTMLGALSKVCNNFTLDELNKEIILEFSKKISPEMLKNNLLAAEKAYNEVKC